MTPFPTLHVFFASLAAFPVRKWRLFIEQNVMHFKCTNFLSVLTERIGAKYIRQVWWSRLYVHAQTVALQILTILDGKLKLF